MGIPFALFLAVGSTCHAQKFEVFPLSGADAIPSGIATGSDGHLWFTLGALNKIGRISVAGEIEEYSLPQARSWPSRITGGTDGAMWFVESWGGRIGRITHAGQITEFPIPLKWAVPTAITRGPGGELWVAGGVHGGGAFAARISLDGKFDLRQFPKWTEISSLSVAPGGSVWAARPYDNLLTEIRPDGALRSLKAYRPYLLRAVRGSDLCFIPLDSSAIVCRAATGDFETHEIGHPAEDFVEDSSGALWITTTAGPIVRLSPSGSSQTIALPAPKTWVGAITLGPDGALWFLAKRPTAVYRFHPGTNRTP